MPTVDADSSSIQADSQPKSGGLAGGASAAQHCSTLCLNKEVHHFIFVVKLSLP